MKGKYKGCDIEVTKENPLFGLDRMIFYSIFDNGYEVDSGFSNGDDTVREFYQSLKEIVDDYRENPNNY